MLLLEAAMLSPLTPARRIAAAGMQFRALATLQRSQSFRLDPENPRRLLQAGRESNDEPRNTVVITGAAGNLGEKAAKHLLSSSTVKYNLILMDASPCPREYQLDRKEMNGHEVEYVQCDFSTYDKSWANKIKNSWAAFLFAAQHPTPDASSKDVINSMMINSNFLEACADGKLDRIIFASSNHVMGGTLNSTGKIEPNARPQIGTKYQISGASMDSTLYASAKAAAEAQIQAMVASGRLPGSIILRIGFCQPGENKKESLPKTGDPSKRPSDRGKAKSSKDQQEEKAMMDWWRGMYLSNEDLSRLVDSCLAPELNKHAKRVIHVNGVSANPNSRWVTDNNEIGYTPSQYAEAT